MRVVLLAVTLACSPIQCLVPLANLHAARVPCARHSAPLLKGGLRGVADDILDYLTNMGGYTGFTEQQLKGETSSLNEVDMERWGQPKTDIDENVTTAFVVILALFPLVLGYIGIKVFGAPQLFTFPSPQ